MMITQILVIKVAQVKEQKNLKTNEIWVPGCGVAWQKFFEEKRTLLD
jgi:hypothetical protein